MPCPVHLQLPNCNRVIQKREYKELICIIYLARNETGWRGNVSMYSKWSTQFPRTFLQLFLKQNHCRQIQVVVFCDVVPCIGVLPYRVLQVSYQHTTLNHNPEHRGLNLSRRKDIKSLMFC